MSPVDGLARPGPRAVTTTGDRASARPRIGIVGSQGAYGRWLRAFFERRMGLEVLGSDPVAAEGDRAEALLAGCDVLVFAVPIRQTAAVIARYAQLAQGRERGQLWIDLTSIKSAPVAAMLASQAEVAGLHPMTAPPKSPTLKGRVMVVCAARVDRWRDWLQDLLDALQAQCVQATPEHHDQVMALVQAMVHASHLAQAGVLREYSPQLGTLGALMPFRTVSFEMDAAIVTRILSLNPAIYEDIQFDNPYVGQMLERLASQLLRLRDQVWQGDDDARAAFRAQFLQANRAAIDTDALADGNYRFERIGYLLADLAETHVLSVHLPQDRAGSLRALLDVFERNDISLTSIHSSRTPAGDVHFRFGLHEATAEEALLAARRQIADSGIGVVLE